MRSTRWFAAALALPGATAVSARPWPGKAEREAAMAEVFAKADADGNGALSAEEATTFHTLMRQRIHTAMFSRADANADGQLTVEELRAARPARGGCGGEAPPEE